MIKVITAKDIQKAIKPIKGLKSNDAYSIIRLMQFKYPGSVTLELDKYYRIDNNKFVEFMNDNQIELEKQ